MDRIAGRFARVEPRRRMRHLVLGLLADLVGAKNYVRAGQGETIK